MKHKICKIVLILQICHKDPQNLKLLILYKDFELSNKLVEGTYENSKIWIEVSDNCNGHPSDESGNKIIDSVPPDQLLDNSANLEPLHVDFDVKPVA